MNGAIKKVSQYSDLAAAGGVVLIVVMMIVPMPPMLLDLFITLNISMALAIVVATLYIPRPLDFSAFPSLLLLTTLFRLAINISVTRLILLEGDAGHVVEAFGTFVVGGNVVVGLIIFLILVVIQFVVITNGAGRVAEVSARFTLDAMPGKQMAIDADLNAGQITEEQARQRREDISKEADFHGAMDGASKFVKGDAIAAIIITVINLLGGFGVGVAQKGLPWGEALSTYSLLTIGDGLVSQIPALLISVATGLIVTRSTTNGDLGQDAAKQLFASSRALVIGGGSMLLLALVPGLPKPPFLVVGAIMLALAYRARSAEAAGPVEDDLPALPAADPTEMLVQEMSVDPLEVVLATDLVDLVDAGGGGDLLDRVRALRRKVALEVGLVLPPVRTRDSLDLAPGQYQVLVSGVEVGRGQAPAGKVLALGDHLETLPGATTVEPVFGLQGKWLPVEMRHQAEMTGATVVDRGSVLITHLGEVVRAHASRLLSREDVKALVESVRRVHPVVVEELVPSQLSLGEVQRVLRGLLDERVPVRDLVRIFEALSLRARTSTDVDGLVEAARAGLAPAVADAFSRDGVLRVVTLDPLMEHEMAEHVRPTEDGPTVQLDPGRTEAFLDALAGCMTRADALGVDYVLVCAPGLRSALHRLVAAAALALAVLSYTEAGQAPRVEAIGTVSHASAVAS
ncbi:MAG: Flagellar biosynthesis protein FlhA [uncultured Solirubrobacteraceae bacterium]|uniref:Flagellar biosynthesis protein FlhA n=1 Tax=uncultured Solirubrobacteraceae bacterium TaxID=1162706 RepID=A0A6J4SAJ7_9ACTN|nr:MAG: Flagellar biosynthesis protein FlhA [uncultured Solirubrobacteraceae bacterium]